MVKEFVKQWDENKYKLEGYFKNTPLEEYRNYKDIEIGRASCRERV